MTKIEVILPPATLLFFETDDDFRQRALMRSENLKAVSAYITAKLKGVPALAGLVPLGTIPPHPHVQIIAVEPRRVTRWGRHFGAEFPSAVESIIQELSAVKPAPGKLLIEVAYTDDAAFNGRENHYADFGYLYARLVVTDA